MIFQSFEWYLEDTGTFYNDMLDKLDELKSIGITGIWLPPVYKATGTNDVGYGVYDIYDLGEFDQKGSIRTKYGTKDELFELIEEIHKRDMKVYLDVVLNHKAGADESEVFDAVMVDENDRTQDVSDVMEIEGFTKFNFENRQGKYSEFKYNHNHFTAVDYDAKSDTHAIYRILGEDKGFSQAVSMEKGNFDYLMFSDLDLNHPDVKEELKSWALWIIRETGVDGFRMDALKHMDADFIKEFLDTVYDEFGDEFYIFGEYWSGDLHEIDRFLERIDYGIDLVDAPLHFNLFNASRGPYDLRTLFDHTVTKAYPLNSVSFVDNHDTQIGESLESSVDIWFKIISYALIMMYQDGYPCIFYGDYYGTEHQAPLKDDIAHLAHLRNTFAYGAQDNYFEDPSCIAFVRHGDEAHPYKSCIIASNGDANQIKVFLGTEEADSVYADYTANMSDKITVDDEGYAVFKVKPGSVSIWAKDNIDLK